MSHSVGIHNNAASLAEPVVVNNRVLSLTQNHNLTVRIIDDFVLDFLCYIPLLPTNSKIQIRIAIILLNDDNTVVFPRI